MRGTRKGRTRRLAVLVAGLVGALGLGVAVAQWIASGSGSGYAKATTAQALTTSTAATTAELYPGKTGGSLYLVVNNPNPFNITITAVHPNGTISPDAGHASCVTTGVSFTDQTGLSQVVPATANATFTVGGVAMDNTSDNGCQGATFTVPVSIDAQS